jgi:hypothetical protein
MPRSKLSIWDIGVGAERLCKQYKFSLVQTDILRKKGEFNKYDNR